MAKQAPEKPATVRGRTARRPVGRVNDQSPFLLDVSGWPVWRSYLILVAATLLCLIPFSGKAFHIDDTLFLFAAKQIVQHPLDPYGFNVVWNKTLERMSDVTKNPPLACYYAALVGATAGWSERALHLAFLAPALALVLGTYRLARRFTRYPLLATFATLLTPGLLVSATSVMCDTLMVALWLWATTLWVEGLEPRKPWYLLASSLLIAASALTKYFGAALIPLLLVYSLVRLRRVGWWAAYFLIPVFALVGYEVWTLRLYGQGLIASASEFAGSQREIQEGSTMAHALVALSFAGGCTFSALALAPLAWSRKQILVAAPLCGLAAASQALNWVDYGRRVGGDVAAQANQEHWITISLQLAFCIASGVSVMGVAIADVRRHRNAESWLLALWVVGTWVFAGFLNWTVNARSVLPLIPAAGILIFRRVDSLPMRFAPRQSAAIAACGLIVTAILSLWVTEADVAMANSAREAASQIYQKTRAERAPIYFLGHWGFQYYMQDRGFIPGDEENTEYRVGDLVIVPANNTQIAGFPAQFVVAARQDLQLLPDQHATTMGAALSAGFYSSYWGPLPFAFGKVPPEVYYFGRIVPADQIPSSTEGGPLR